MFGGASPFSLDLALDILRFVLEIPHFPSNASIENHFKFKIIGFHRHRHRQNLHHPLYKL